MLHLSPCLFIPHPAPACKLSIEGKVCTAVLFSIFVEYSENELYSSP